MSKTRSQEHYTKTKTENLRSECVCANSRVYLVGSQDGGFPRLGWHTAGEMSGLWLHPIKLADGFWLEVQDSCSGRVEWLSECSSYTSGPFWGRHTYDHVLDGLSAERIEFAPLDLGGVAVRYTFKDDDAAQRQSEAVRLNLRFVVKAHLIPVWGSKLLGSEEVGCQGSYLRGTDIAVVSATHLKGIVVAGIDRPVTSCSFASELLTPENTGDGGYYGEILTEIELPTGGETSIWLFIAGSCECLEEAIETLESMRCNRSTLFEDRAENVEKRMSQCTLTVPDPILREAFDYGKLSVEFLERDVPGVGSGICAGIPEYPWWFGCDSCFSVPGLLVSGRGDLAKSTMRLLAEAAERDNNHGRIPHEVVTDGTIANKGNAQETPQFVATVREVWKWTGDDAFLSELYRPCKRGFDWLLSDMDDDGDLFPEGYGIAEVAHLDLEMIDTAVHTLRAARSLVDMAGYLGDVDMEWRASEVASTLSKTICERFWLEEEGRFGDVIARPSQMLERIGKIKRSGEHNSAFMDRLTQAETLCREASDDSERAWSFGLCLALVLLLDETVPIDRRIRQIELFESPLYTGEYGIRMSESKDAAAMTISTGQMVMAEFMAGRPEKAVEYIHKIHRTTDLRFPGYPSEYSPDKGCFVQAWTNYGVVYAVIGGLFGIDPHVPRGTLTVRPCLPRDWDLAVVRRLPVGDRLLDVEVRREASGLQTRLSPSDGLGDLPFEICEMEV